MKGGARKMNVSNVQKIKAELEKIQDDLEAAELTRPKTYFFLRISPSAAHSPSWS